MSDKLNRVKRKPFKICNYEDVNLESSGIDLLKVPIISIIKKLRLSKNATYHRLILDFINENPEEIQFAVRFLNQLTEGSLLRLLDREVGSFIKDVMRISWFVRGKIVDAAFTNYVQCLVTAHNYHAVAVLEDLFSMLVPEVPEDMVASLYFTPGFLNESELLVQTKLVDLIAKVTYLVPMSSPCIFKFARKYSPYFKDHVHKHATYTLSLLMLSHAQYSMSSKGQMKESFRKLLLEVIILNLLKLDLHSPRSEFDDQESDDEIEQAPQIFEMEFEESQREPESSSLSEIQHKISHTLDIQMSIMLTYVHNVIHGQTTVESAAKDSKPIFDSTSQSILFTSSKKSSINCRIGSVKYSDKAEEQMLGCECNKQNHDENQMNSLYRDLITVFDSLILPTHSSSHVQFILFYFLSVRPGKVADFLDYLWKKFYSPSNPLLVRRNAIDYFGSLLTRGSFITFSHLHSSLKLISSWCEEYSDRKTKDGRMIDRDVNDTCFYSACQVLFYTFTFSYREYTSSKSHLKLAASLQIDKLINSPLNPLSMCMDAVLMNFSAITNHFQIAYCGNIIEENRRLVMPVVTNQHNDALQMCSKLEMFFPFDPYLLPRSLVYIKRYYKEFQGLPEEIEMNLSQHKDVCQLKEEEENTDMDASFLDISADAAYGMSPGFKRFLT